MDVKERFLTRFQSEVKNKNLADVKYFIRRGRVSVTDLFEEANQFEDSVAAKDCKTIENVDSSLPKTKYNAAFE